MTATSQALKAESVTQILVGGEWLQAGDPQTLRVTNPATGEEIRQLGVASSADVDAAVQAAAAALADPSWTRAPTPQRAAWMWRAADLIDQHADELARLETLDNGQPLGVARHVSVPGTAEHFRYFAGWATKLEGTTAAVANPAVFHYTRREPVGVCALITPWNFPLMIASWKLAPALACGNTVVLKPAEQTSLTAIRLCELLVEAGFPPGVVNLVTGGPEVGRALVRHPLVDKVSFTGSTSVGQEIMRIGADRLTRVTLELGGKTPMIVARDANLNDAVTGAVQGALFNSGQVCAAYSRFYVHSSRVDEFADKAAVGASSLRVGPGLEPDTEMGPLVSVEHLDTVDGFVRSGLEEGAELMTGGKRVADPGLEGGNFYEPTVFRGVRDDMRIARDEIFGPVISIMSYDDLDEAVQRANASDYGLAACVWTKDLTTAHRLAADLRVGSVFVNMLHVPDAAAPWGGFKASGVGREMGPQALEAYTEIKGVFINLAGHHT